MPRYKHGLAQRHRTTRTDQSDPRETTDTRDRGRLPQTDADHPWLKAALHGSETNLRRANHAGTTRLIARGQRERF